MSYTRSLRINLGFPAKLGLVAAASLLLGVVIAFATADISAADSFGLGESAAVTAFKITASDSFGIKESITTLGLFLIQVSDKIGLKDVGSLEAVIVTITQTVVQHITSTVYGGYYSGGNDYYYTQIIVPFGGILGMIGATVWSKIREFEIILIFTVAALLTEAYYGIAPSWVPLLIIILLAAGLTQLVSWLLGGRK